MAKKLRFFVFFLCLTGVAWSDVNEDTVFLPGNVPLVLVKVPAGKFLMGSPEGERGNVLENETQHEVTLTLDYYIGKTEVTQRQWRAVMGTAMPTSCGGWGWGDEYPVSCVTWNDMAGPGGFLEKLNEHLETQVFRLPTEAEWERAARAGTTTRFSHGDVLECGDECGGCETHIYFMWWCGNRPFVCIELDPVDWNTCLAFDLLEAEPVGLKEPNPFGLHDMHGNLWEFVQDRYGEFSSVPVTDPTGPTSGNDRVIRGGDWSGGAGFSRSASRVSANPGDPDIQAANNSTGFRIAATSLEGLGFQINAGLNGSWWNGPVRSGEGVQIEVSDGGDGSLLFLVTIYSYDTIGNQIFMIAVGTVNGDTAEVDVFITEGGLWGAFFDPMLVLESQWGTGTFTGHSCESMHMELRPNAEYQVLGYTNLIYDLIRLTVPLLPCPMENPN